MGLRPGVAGGGGNGGRRRASALTTAQGRGRGSPLPDVILEFWWIGNEYLHTKERERGGSASSPPGAGAAALRGSPDRCPPRTGVRAAMPPPGAALRAPFLLFSAQPGARGRLRTAGWRPHAAWAQRSAPWDSGSWLPPAVVLSLSTTWLCQRQLAMARQPGSRLLCCCLRCLPNAARETRRGSRMPPCSLSPGRLNASAQPRSWIPGEGLRHEGPALTLPGAG